ncbi:hypothetical protein LTR82_007465 [Friedmanniomyces endolithicus]|uniref:Uncharacterized protein n=1 Tax=Friedmanniomyces endolithicus TaxID=329885 RepID=A0AAN6FP77_9PEZI|nr:hypothetical protein LTR82_007465 [Friedmanniomyces endolithicus]
MPVLPSLTNSFAIVGHEVFDRLSDAVLSDAIKLQTASVLAEQHDSPSMSLATSANSPQQQQEQQHQSGHTHPLHPLIQQPALPQPQHQEPGTAAPMHAPLAVDTEFLHSYNDIQTLYHHQRVDDSVMHLSQDWLGYIGTVEPAGGYMANAHLQPQQHRRPFIPSQQAPYQPPSTRM